MLRLLVEYDANLQGRLISFNDEPNVTLLYDASYFGHAHLVKYLLQQRGNPDTQVKFLGCVGAVEQQNCFPVPGGAKLPLPKSMCSNELQGFKTT